MNENRFYVYGHYRKDTGELFYIGKGTGSRSHTFSGRSKKWQQHACESPVSVKIFKDNLNADEALILEADLIKQYHPIGNSTKTNVVKELNYELINSMLLYDETSPTFLRWKVDCGWTGKYFKKKSGTVAGTVTKRNKIVITIKSKSYIVSRIVWILHNKTLRSDLIIDHIDGNTSNNKISNLRAITTAENTRNKKRNSRNKSGIVGVYFKNMKGDPYWTATWQDLQGNKHRRYFSVNKYSYEGAKQLAVAAREEAILLLNQTGAGYTDRHLGK